MRTQKSGRDDGAIALKLSRAYESYESAVASSVGQVDEKEAKKW